jgi:hypothetical protein
MGMPSGLARSSKAATERRPAAAALAAEYLRNSLLEIAGMETSLFTTARRMLGAHYNLKPNSQKQGELKFARTRGREIAGKDAGATD